MEDGLFFAVAVTSPLAGIRSGAFITKHLLATAVQELDLETPGGSAPDGRAGVGSNCSRWMPAQLMRGGGSRVLTRPQQTRWRTGGQPTPRLIWLAFTETKLSLLKGALLSQNNPLQTSYQ